MKRLREKVAASLAEKDEEDNIRKMYSSQEVWREVVDKFFRRIEIVYLLEFALDGSLTFSRKIFPGDNNTFNYGTLNISFGNNSIVLRPVFAPETLIFGYIDVRSYPFNGRESIILCSLDRGWLLPKKESGLRLVLSRLLPMKFVPIEEELFHEMLADLVEDHQPFLIYDQKRFLGKISILLDELISEERQERIGHFFVSSPIRTSINHAKAKAISLISSTNHTHILFRKDPIKMLSGKRHIENEK